MLLTLSLVKLKISFVVLPDLLMLTIISSLFLKKSSLNFSLNFLKCSEKLV